MVGNFDIIRRVNFEAIDSPITNDLALAIYGSGKGGPECDDVDELLKPTTQQDALISIDLLIENLLEIGPSNTRNGNLQNAITDTIEVYKNYPNHLQFFIITSKVDNTCMDLDRETIEVVAKKSDVDYSITLVATGELDNVDHTTFNNFSDNYCIANTALELEDCLNDTLILPPFPYGPYQP